MVRWCSELWCISVSVFQMPVYVELGRLNGLISFSLRRIFSLLLLYILPGQPAYVFLCFVSVCGRNNMLSLMHLCYSFSLTWIFTFITLHRVCNQFRYDRHTFCVSDVVLGVHVHHRVLVFTSWVTLLYFCFNLAPFSPSVAAVDYITHQICYGLQPTTSLALPHPHCPHPPG